MRILKEKAMPLLARKRINFEIDHAEKATPSRADLKVQVSQQLNVKPELVSIRHIYPKFGQNKSKVVVHVYEDEKRLKFLETPKGKKAKKEQKPVAPKPAK